MRTLLKFMSCKKNLTPCVLGKKQDPASMHLHDPVAPDPDEPPPEDPPELEPKSGILPGRETLGRPKIPPIAEGIDPSTVPNKPPRAEYYALCYVWLMDFFRASVSLIEICTYLRHHPLHLRYFLELN